MLTSFCFLKITFCRRHRHTVMSFYTLNRYHASNGKQYIDGLKEYFGNSKHFVFDRALLGFGLLLNWGPPFSPGFIALVPTLKYFIDHVLVFHSV